MHTVELFEAAVALAEDLGYQVRLENLGGVAGGGCQVGEKRFLFVDLSLSTVDQLDQVVTALKSDAAIYGVHDLQIPRELASLLELRRAA